MWIENVLGAADAVFQIKNLLLMTVGVLAGLIAGAIPGFTITMAVVLTLPFTFALSPIEGLSTMIGVFVGGLSGGLMSGVLTGIPGTPSSVATTFDGFPMARNGKPGLALGIGVWSSFAGGVLSAILLMALAPQLAKIGLEFGPNDYVALVLFALTITASLSGEQLLKGMIAGLLGLLLATVGEDSVNGIERLSFGVEALESGFAFLPVLVGLFAFSQLMSDVANRDQARNRLMDAGTESVKVEHLAAIRELVRNWAHLIRSSLIGAFTGILPAAGGSISNILAYDQAKKSDKHPEKFGTGTPAGIIASESANNATAGGALITMMALGIPGDIVTAVMLGALLIHDVVPSPSFIGEQPRLAYGIFIAFFFANFLMLAVQSVALRGFLLVTKARMYLLASIILCFCAIGVFGLHNSIFDIWTMFLFGILGFAMRLLGFPLAPMILGVVLGPIAEVWLNRAVSSNPDLTLYFTRPWSLFFIIVAVFSVAFPWYQKARREDKAWANWFMPALCLALSVPLFMMEGVARPILAGGLILLAGWLFLKTGKKLAGS
ncbi:MAG: tripartite tricarboxylate transporter permease [Rhodospirillales bacterium]